jgi:hypothetical protein
MSETPERIFMEFDVRNLHKQLLVICSLSIVIYSLHEGKIVHVLN